MATISSILRLEDQMSNPLKAIISAMSGVTAASGEVSSSTMSIENAIQKSTSAMAVAATNAEIYQSKIDQVSDAMDKNAAKIEELEQRQASAYSDKRQAEIEKLITKQDKLNETYQKTEVALTKANSTYGQQESKVGQLNQKLSEMNNQNNQIQKQTDKMKNPFDKWAIRVTGVYSALRLVRRVLNSITRGFSAVMGATKEWEGVTNKFNKSIEKTQQTIGKQLLPLAAVGSDLVAQAFDWIGQKANQTISWIIDNIDLVVNALSLFATAGLIVVAVFAIANWQTFALVGVILLVANALTDFGITAEDILGTVGGIFGWLYGVVYNIFINLGNAIASFVEFFANVWHDPIGSVGRLFYDLLDTILGIVETVAGAIGHLLGQDWNSGIAQFRQNLTAGVRAEFGEAAFQVERMAMIDERITYQAGREFGTNIGQKLTGIEGKLDNFDLSKYSTGKAIKTKGEVKMDGEDIKMLLDAATEARRPIYQTLSPQIILEGTVIRETADANQILNIITDWVEEISDSALEVPA